AAGCADVRGDPERRFDGVASLAEAGPGQVSYLAERRYLDALRATGAGAVVVPPAHAAAVPDGAVAVVTEAAQLGFARVAALFHPRPAPKAGIHPTAAVGEGATIGEGTEVGAFAVIGDGARIGRGCVVHPHAVVGPGVEIGDGCRLHAHSSVSHALLGRGVVLHPGARVGQEGFSFVPDAQGRFETMPQLGRVVIGDGAEIGANACVDRGALGDTVLGPGTRLDNLVQVGHNVRTGRGCILVAQSGVSGSTVLEDFVTVAAQAGLTGHLRLGTKARVGAQAGVMNDVPAGTDVLGSPAWPARQAWRAFAHLRKIGRGGGGEGKAD
ncbi:UDP-3-O-(3-hydroxymyristoyl)glucosamine N-acyltransferase, partial [Craurococcus roseus]|uniref:UDP-3-O-(3-hydroxymyristoyl)glucosamine N-acyltransferase n=1 Tax=Craurococcus roseus TaxID=77585 RepID=UPI0031D11E85